MKLSSLAALVAAVWLSVHGAPSRAEGAATDAPAAKAPAKAKPKAAAAKPGAAEVTLTGQLTCAKCGLHESATCQNVLRVPDAGAKTETRYYLTKNDVAEEHHEEVCGGQVSATVTGSVSEQGGKKLLTASAIKIN